MKLNDKNNIINIRNKLLGISLLLKNMDRVKNTAVTKKGTANLYTGENVNQYTKLNKTKINKYNLISFALGFFSFFFFCKKINSDHW